jgi:DnaJ-class molecular chaperone
VAYNTLSDPELRKKYNEFGKQQEGEGGFVDPEAVFSTLVEFFNSDPSIR